jgi:uncharacterized membrane protein
MTLEPWFIFAIISAIAGGIGSFLYKIAAKEKIDIVLLSFCSAILSSAYIFGAVLLLSDWSGFWHPMLLFAGLNSLFFLLTSVTKVRGLENIDSAIFFPLYKVFGPGLIIVMSLLAFGERFSVYEWIGLLLGLTIPFLLISKTEDARQLNLKAGLWWLFVTVVISVLGVTVWKHGADVAPNTWMYILAVELTMIPIAFTALWQKHQSRLGEKFQEIKRRAFLKILLVASVVHAVAGAVFVFAITSGGELGIVYTINSLYILIPIILSIIFYNEHWNARKVIAIGLSILALGFFG